MFFLQLKQQKTSALEDAWLEFPTEVSVLKQPGRTHEEIFERILALLKEVPTGGCPGDQDDITCFPGPWGISDMKFHFSLLLGGATHNIYILYIWYINN